METKKLNSSERRLAEVFYISEKREFNYDDLMLEFDISHATAGRDIKYIRDTLGVPIMSSSGRCGGLMIYGTWSVLSKKMTKEQRDTIIYLVGIHEGDVKRVLISIMRDFGDIIVAEKMQREFYKNLRTK